MATQNSLQPLSIIRYTINYTGFIQSFIHSPNKHLLSVFTNQTYCQTWAYVDGCLKEAEQTKITISPITHNTISPITEM